MPDVFSAAQGFTDGDGSPVTSSLGMGGLMFVGSLLWYRDFPCE